MSARSKLSFTEVGAVFVTLATVTLEAERLQVVQSVSAPSALRHDMIDVKRLILGGSSTNKQCRSRVIDVKNSRAAGSHCTSFGHSLRSEGFQIFGKLNASSRHL